MIIVETPFHLILSSCSHRPQKACTGKCRKTWWDFDLKKSPDASVCRQCGDSLDDAVEGVHYSIRKCSDRPFEAEDFQDFEEFSKKEVEELTRLARMGAVFDHMSKVKSAFEEKA